MSTKVSKQDLIIVVIVFLVNTYRATGGSRQFSWLILTTRQAEADNRSNNVHITIVYKYTVGIHYFNIWNPNEIQMSTDMLCIWFANSSNFRNVSEI